jgi:serine/threonine protein kinase
LRHPVLPKVSDHFTEGGEQYLVMEHIAGDDLAKRLEGAQKPFPLSWVLFWADQLLDALAYLHSHEPPIIHRDIKPQNLKLTDENHIVLLDFGLSKNSTGQTKTSGSSGSSGSVVGYTPHYAPMEQIRGTGTNPKSDIYSLSATLYQLMTNTVPADALTRADALLNGSPDPIVALDQINPEVPREVSDVILHGMEVSQEKRFGTAKEMQKTLRKAFSQMQEAMSAQTIAFTAPGSGDGSSKIEQPVVAHTSQASSSFANGADSEATRVRSEPSVSVPVESPAYGGQIDGGVRQSDVKTEVFHAGSTPLYTPSEPTYDAPVAPATPAQEDNWDASPVTPTDNFAPDATRPNIAYDAGVPSSPFVAGETFSQPAEEVQDPFATRTPEPQIQEAPIQQPSRPVVAAVAPKKKSKAPLVVGALAALFIFGVVAVAGGWFVYSNYYANAAVEASPTPEPTLEIAPTPEPTLEAITNTNSNTSIAETDTNSNANANSNSDIIAVEPTPSQYEPTEPRDTPNTKPQRTEVKRNTTATTTTTKGNPGQPTGKSTPKKSNRTVIMQ